MALVIDAAVGGTDTNSYLTLIAAEELMLTRQSYSDWTGLTDAAKNAALVWSTRTLSNFNWKGIIASDTQKQAWPRTSTYDKDDRLYASDSYPEWLTVSCAELAYYFATDDRLADSGTEGFSDIVIGSLEFTVDKYDRLGLVPDYIMTYIRPWLVLGSANNAQVFRV